MIDNSLDYKSTVLTARRWRVPGELGLVVVILIMGGVLSVAGLHQRRARAGEYVSQSQQSDHQCRDADVVLFDHGRGDDVRHHLRRN